MDLCTVISEKFIPQAINLIQSYKINSFNKKVYIYYFNTDPDKLKIFSDNALLASLDFSASNAYKLIKIFLKKRKVFVFIVL